MPYEATIVITIPEQATYPQIKEAIRVATETFKMDPDSWSIQVSSEANTSWAHIFYSHPSPTFLDLIVAFWAERIRGIATERVHRITQAQYFEELVAKTRSGGAGRAIVEELATLSAKGVTTTGMIAWMQEVCADADLVLRELRTVREAGYEPSRGIDSYP